LAVQVPEKGQDGGSRRDMIRPSKGLPNRKVKRMASDVYNNREKGVRKEKKRKKIANQLLKPKYVA
jgi:hypothetical protein